MVSKQSNTGFFVTKSHKAIRETTSSQSRQKLDEAVHVVAGQRSGNLKQKYLHALLKEILEKLKILTISF